MLNSDMESATVKYVKAIKETDIYKQYYERLERLKRHPEFYEKVNEFRLKNYEIQNSSQAEELLEKVDALEKEYEQFRENPLVDDFLRAELAFCRMMQEINICLMDELGFE